MISSRIKIMMLIGCICIAGCGDSYPTLERADDLAQELKDRGLAWETSSRISFGDMKYAKIDEGIALESEEFRIEILRIVDSRTYKIFSSAAALSGVIGGLLDEKAEHPPTVYKSAPFVVVIRKEPNPGQVASVLEKILPRDEQ